MSFLKIFWLNIAYWQVCVLSNTKKTLKAANQITKAVQMLPGNFRCQKEEYIWSMFSRCGQLNTAVLTATILISHHRLTARQ